MKLSGIVTNEGMKQMLPSLVDTQYKELIESRKRMKKQAKFCGNQNQNKSSEKGMRQVNLRSYIDNKPGLYQNPSMGSQKIFFLFPSEWHAEKRSNYQAARGA